MTNTKPEWLTDKMALMLDGAVARREWRSVTESALLAELPRDDRKQLRGALVKYVRDVFDRAGAGFSGRWQS